MPVLHFITGEYPPDQGGVADYTRLVAEELAGRGHEVHIWAPSGVPTEPTRGVFVHRDLGELSPGDLARAGRMLDTYPSPRRLIVQYVPHAFGYRAMNIAFAAWLLGRSRRSKDSVGLMVHEAHVAFFSSWKENVVAAANRLMDTLILRAADRVWVSTPAWGDALEPYSFRSSTEFEWLPVPSNIPRVSDPGRSARVKQKYAPSGSPLIGHFGTYGVLIGPLLEELVPMVLKHVTGARMMFLGRGAGAFRQSLATTTPAVADRLFAPGGLDDSALSHHLEACDLFLQPYPEGLSTRRGSAMAVVAHGRPMVSNSGNYTEPAWTDSGAASLVPLKFGMQGMADEAVRMMGDAGSLERSGSAAESLYRDRFDIRHTVDALASAVPSARGGSGGLEVER